MFNIFIKLTASGNHLKYLKLFLYHILSYLYYYLSQKIHDEEIC